MKTQILIVLGIFVVCRSIAAGKARPARDTSRAARLRWEDAIGDAILGVSIMAFLLTC